MPIKIDNEAHMLPSAHLLVFAMLQCVHLQGPLRLSSLGSTGDTQHAVTKHSTQHNTPVKTAPELQ